MLKYSAYVGEIDEYYGNYKWQKLPSAGHRAFIDCLAVAALIKEMAGPLPSNSSASKKYQAEPLINIVTDPNLNQPNSNSHNTIPKTESDKSNESRQIKKSALKYGLLAFTFYLLLKVVDKLF